MTQLRLGEIVNSIQGVEKVIIAADELVAVVEDAIQTNDISTPEKHWLQDAVTFYKATKLVHLG